MRGTQGKSLEMYVHIMEHVCDLHEITRVANREEVYQERAGGDSMSGNTGTWEQFHIRNLYSTEL